MESKHKLGSVTAETWLTMMSFICTFGKADSKENNIIM